MSVKLVMGAVLALCFVGMAAALYAGGHADRCHAKKLSNEVDPELQSHKEPSVHKTRRKTA